MKLLLAYLLLGLTPSSESPDARGLPISAGSLATHPAPPRLCEMWQNHSFPQSHAAGELNAPQVRLGVVTSAADVEVTLETAATLSWVEFGVAQQATLPAGTKLTVKSIGAVQPFLGQSLACPAPFRGMLGWSTKETGDHAADSLITIEPESPEGRSTVERVPFGMGYAWAGVANRTFRQTLTVTFGARGLIDVVNTIDVESLLKSVVPSEMPPSSPQQALRAQAIAARNFIVTGLGHRHPHSPFDFCAEQHCQVYQGQGGEHPASSEAVESTRGEVLMLGDRVVRALYSARCGGHTEDNDVPWQESADPALRGRSDLKPSDKAEDPLTWQSLVENQGSAFCDPPGGGRVWEVTFSGEALTRLIDPSGKQVGRLSNITGEERGPGGRFRRLTFTGSRGQRTLERELPIRRALGNLKSAAFLITDERRDDGALRAITLRGTGWGHGVGMCQQGAIGRAQASATCGEILSHYYNGATTSPFWTERVTGCPAPK